jgi:hypothetical protein
MTGSEVVGVEVLPPMLAALRRVHPQLQIELSLSNVNEDLLRRDGFSFDLPVWVVTHENLRASRRVSLVFEHLVASLTKYVRSAL